PTNPDTDGDGVTDGQDKDSNASNISSSVKASISKNTGDKVLPSAGEETSDVLPFLGLAVFASLGTAGLVRKRRNF
ncbi:LPXTG cell wall anchor domain-containing protein, partial [Streptococcus pluranimalium]